MGVQGRIRGSGDMQIAHFVSIGAGQMVAIDQEFCHGKRENWLVK
jgi:hypothetical protein